MVLMNEYEFLKTVGIPVEKMPEPGHKAVLVNGRDEITISNAVRALRNLGYEAYDVTDKPDWKHCFYLSVEDYPEDVVFLRDWIAKHITGDVEYIIRKFSKVGITRSAALFHMAELCVKMNNQEVK